MKKTISVLLVLVMALSLLAGCGAAEEKPTEAPTAAPTEAPAAASAVEILEKTWAGYTETASEEMLFPIGGGDSENMTMDVPGKFDTAKGEELENMLHLPADLQAQIDDAASMMHMMNQNTFTAAAYHLVSGTDAKAFVSGAAEAIKNTQFMCGFPEKVVVATVGDYVVAAFGHSEVLDPVMAQLTAAFAGAEIVIDEPIQ